MRFLLEQRMLSAPEAHASSVSLSRSPRRTTKSSNGSSTTARCSQASRHSRPARPKRLLRFRVDQPPDLATHLDDEIGLALHGLASDDSKEAIRSNGLQGTARVHGPIAHQARDRWR